MYIGAVLTSHHQFLEGAPHRGKTTSAQQLNRQKDFHKIQAV